VIASRLATFVALVSLAPALALGQTAAAPEAPPEQAAATGQKTVAVVALAGYDRLMEDIDFLGELGGRPATADMVEGMLAFFTGGRGLEGLDKSRPIGVVLRTDGSAFTPLVCLPIPDLDPILELAENLGLEPLLDDSGVYEVATPEQTVYVKQSGEWTYAAQTAEALANLPADPSGPLKQIVGSYDLGAMVLAQNVPEMYRQIALEQLRQGMEEGLQQEEGESDEAFARRRELAETQIDQIGDMIQGLERLTVGWSVDTENKRTFLDAELIGVEGSDMALAMSVYDDSTSGVAGFHRPEAAASLLTAATTPPELLEKQKEQIDATVAMLRTQAAKAIDEGEELPDDPEFRETLKSAANELIDAYGDMLRSGRVDLGASLSLAGEGYDLVAGAFVADPSKVESAFKKLAEAAEKQDPDFPGVEWGYAEHTGVTLHGMTVTFPEDKPETAKAREVLGESLRVVMGVGAERVYLAAGPRGEEALKRAIDDSASMTDEPIKPAEVIVSLQQTLSAAEKLAVEPQAEQVIGMMLDALEQAPEGTDRIVFTSEAVEDGVRMRYLVEEGVLKAIGQTVAAAAAMQAQQQGAGGPNGF